MNNRILFRNIMHYGEFDRMPVVHWHQWPETLQRWHAEGLPEQTDPRTYLNANLHWGQIGAELSLYPLFEDEVIEESNEYLIYRDGYGVVQQAWKHRQCIPHFIDFSLKTAADWPRFKERLQPDPGRLPENLDQLAADADASDLPIMTPNVSMMGWIRNWMGVENMCYLMYDSPDCYADMIDTLSDLAVWGLEQVVPKLSTPPELCFGWEDICGKSGPLVSPDIFDKAVAPGYRKVRAKCDELGIALLGLDSDGYVEPLTPNWIDAGVNLLFPIEPGTWGATPEHFRERFGRDLRMVGGFDKLILEKTKADIDAEIERHIPLMKEGGFLMMPDHLITPGTPLENYVYYIERIRELRF